MKEKKKRASVAGAASTKGQTVAQGKRRSVASKEVIHGEADSTSRITISFCWKGEEHSGTETLEAEPKSALSHIRPLLGTLCQRLLFILSIPTIHWGTSCQILPEGTMGIITTVSSSMFTPYPRPFHAVVRAGDDQAVEIANVANVPNELRSGEAYFAKNRMPSSAGFAWGQLFSRFYSSMRLA